jgi:tRNA-specific 2-thiouridylase
MRAGAVSERVAVALSGGVDSAVAALLLIEAGHRVEGLHMSNWEDDSDYCSGAADYNDACAVAEELKIPLHRVSFAAEYRQRVFEYFLAEYAAGRTPNPDVLCNREVKFGVCLDHARRLGASRLATGHYARLAADGSLLRGADPDKDQSYFLHQVDRERLAQALFPVGGLLKSEVRRRAREAGLAVHAKRDSTGICFIGERPFREFLSRYLPAHPGAIETPDGEVVGQHSGLMYYTLGQRQGLGLGGRAGHPEAAWFVAGKDLLRNVLTVVQGRSHPALHASTVLTGAARWIGPAPRLPVACTVKLRYRQRDAAVLVAARDESGLALELAEPAYAVTPGQYAVFYDAERCLGGAVITAALPSPSATVPGTRQRAALTHAPPPV